VPNPEDKAKPEPNKPSWGNISEHHWSRARKDANQEQLEYYRSRSHAPGVAGGGAERNFYCMGCEGVIPYDLELRACPHCGAAIDEHVKRYFNWVEINEPGTGDARALLPFLAAALLVALALAALVWWWLGRNA
jgi:hypothetical protein